MGPDDGADGGRGVHRLGWLLHAWNDIIGLTGSRMELIPEAANFATDLGKELLAVLLELSFDGIFGQETLPSLELTELLTCGCL